MSHASTTGSGTHPRNVARRASVQTGPAGQPQSRILSWLQGLSLFLLLVGTLLGSGTSGVAQAASSQLQDEDAIGLNPAPTFVQHHPKVYLVFWGPKWSQSSGTATISTIEQTFQTLAGSSYNNVLSQYTDSPASSTDLSTASPSDLEDGNYVHNDVRLMTGPGETYGRVIDTTTPPGGLDIGIETPDGVYWGAQIRNEADKEIAAHNWSVNQDSQIIVFPQEGSTYNVLSLPNKWCGMHVFNSTAAHHYAYALVQYGDQNAAMCLGPVGTLSTDTASNIAFWAVHEYAEAATDPVIAGKGGVVFPIYGSGWNTQDPYSATPQEAADLCESQGVYAYYPSIGGATTFNLPYLWSNDANACRGSRGVEYGSPDTSPPFTGKHTVEGLILTHYQQLGADGSFLGGPVSERTPVAGGYASYFVGTSCAGQGYGAIYYSDATGAYEVHGCIERAYVNLGETSSRLGFPTSDQESITGGNVNYFQGTSCAGRGYGAIYYSGSSGANSVRGCIERAYQDLGATSSFLGFPITDQEGVAGGSVNYFQGTSCGSASYGAIYYSGSSGANSVHGCIEREFVNLLETSSFLGFPTSDQTSIQGGSVNYFQGTACGSVNYGAIYYSGGSGAHEVHGCIERAYQDLGETGSRLGFPTSDQYTNSVGYFESDFVGGSIVWEHGTAVVTYN